MKKRYLKFTIYIVAIIMFLFIMINAASDNYIITGNISSYNARNDITVSLWQNNTETKYKTIISGVSTSKNMRYEDIFVIENISEGIYDIVITKQSHLPYTIKDVVIENDIDMTEYLIKLAAGDVNSSGAINLTDVSDIYDSRRFNKVELNNDGYNIIYDVNGNGAIELSDISIIYDSYNFQKTNITVNYSDIVEYMIIGNNPNDIFVDVKMSSELYVAPKTISIDLTKNIDDIYYDLYELELQFYDEYGEGEDFNKLLNAVGYIKDYIGGYELLYDSQYILSTGDIVTVTISDNSANLIFN